MNWPDDVVERVARDIAIQAYHIHGLETLSYSGDRDFSEREWRHYTREAQAALSAITLHDIKAVLEQQGLMIVTKEYGV